MELFLLGGGASAAAALLVGLAFARSLMGIAVLIALGAFAVAAVHALGPANELLQASANANFLGWAAGALVVARTRAIEWLDQTCGRESTPLATSRRRAASRSRVC